MNGQDPASYPSMRDLTALSPPARWTLREVAFRISLGFSEKEVATIHGQSTRWVRGRMARLREEIEGQG